MSLPTHPTLEQLVELIETLYVDKDPKKINTINTYLQGIQKSDDGPHLAELLLGTPGLSLSCQFFGALTYTVTLSKIKGGGAPSFDPILLFQKILVQTSNLIVDRLSNNAPNMFIIRKMFQNLSIVYGFLDIEAPIWRNPLCPLAYILSTHSTPPLDAEINLDQVLPPLLQDPKCNSMILAFVSVIIEELTNDHRAYQKVGIQGETVHEKVQNQVYPVTKSIIIFNLQSSSDDLKLNAIETMASWFTYISFVHNNSQVRYRDLNDIWQYVILTLQSSEDEVLMNTVQLLSMVFEENPLSLNYETRMKFEQMIPSEWSMGIINKFIQEEDYESLNKFCALFAKYVESDELQIATKMLTGESKPLLEFLLNLTNFPLKPIIEEEISKNFSEFWTHVIEIFTSDKETVRAKLKDDEAAIQRVIQNAQSLFAELTKIYFGKIQLTVKDDPRYKEHENDFLSFREAVGEMFDGLFSEVGDSLFEGIASAITSSSDIQQLEASFFLLTNISSSLDKDYYNEGVFRAIDGLFNASFLTRISDLIEQQHVSDDHIKYSIKFLGELDFFYRARDSSYAKMVIDYLLNCLKRFESLHPQLSRTILEICDECRGKLVDSVASWEPMLVEMIGNRNINNYTREKFIQSMSCIIQAIPDPSSQENYIYNMLEMIEKTAIPFVQKAAQSHLNEQELEYTLSLFSSIPDIARGVSIPDQMIMEQPAEFNASKQYWSNYSGRVWEKITRIIKMFTLDVESLAMNNDFTLMAVQTYKDGLIEEFGAFALPYSHVMEYGFQKLTRCNQEKSYQVLLDLMTSLLNCGLRKKTHTSQIISDQDASLIIKTFVADHFNLIQLDPDFLQGAMELYTAMVTHRIGFILRETETMQFMVSTALPLLLSKEKFVIKATCKFWQKLISSHSKATPDEEQILRQLVDQQIGPALTQNLMRGALDCARSDLDQYGLVLVIMVSKHQLRLKDWMIETLEILNSEREANGKHLLKTREVFIKKLMITRGSVRQCMEVLKVFWQESNGLYWNTA